MRGIADSSPEPLSVRWKIDLEASGFLALLRRLETAAYAQAICALYPQVLLFVAQKSTRSHVSQSLVWAIHCHTARDGRTADEARAGVMPLPAGLFCAIELLLIPAWRRRLHEYEPLDSISSVALSHSCRVPSSYLYNLAVVGLKPSAANSCMLHHGQSRGFRHGTFCCELQQLFRSSVHILSVIVSKLSTALSK